MRRNTANDKLIKLDRQFYSRMPSRMAAWGTRHVERLLAIDKINEIYSHLMRSPMEKRPFNAILKLLGMKYRVTDAKMAGIPAKGPLVVVSNHPFGGIEGIILGDLLSRVRPDVKIMGNYLLENIVPIRDAIIPVDPFGRKSSISGNAKIFRQCLRWLKEGGCLIVFPAGEVAHYCVHHRTVTDPPWSRHVGALVRMSRAQVLPVYFPGRNSILFNLMGLIHSRFRTAMLARELISRRKTSIRLSIGRFISGKQMQALDDDTELIHWLRFKTYLLANTADEKGTFHIGHKKIGRYKNEKPIMHQAVIAAVSDRLLAKEIGSLPSSQMLVTHKKWAVYVADSPQIPSLLREIGRLREKTFREVGEGTGKSMDLDLFDRFYRQLILWNHETCEVVGGYRMGDTRAILARFGRKGLYTHSLFHLKTGLLRHLGESLELGRSYIRSEYQRQPNCLAMLWKGICAYVVQNPRYRILFGPVSISNSYHRVSKQIMVQFLERHCSTKELAAHVRPRCPLGACSDPLLLELIDRMSGNTIDDVSMLIFEIEDDGKRVPVLIKHYLKLNGRFIAFNVDRKFSDAIDGLVLVDMMQTEKRLLERFMGKEECNRYRAQWMQEQIGTGM
ncbi:MAG: lysophospholipid acyltransferase family protein [Desulfatitalea sp.]|nr:lysophospholipid acyltransferase family protein [Desulfatitalea sp.]